VRVLVTGGCGFIGSHVVDALLDRGDGVRVLDSLHPRAHDGMPDYLRDEVEYVFARVEDETAVAAALVGVDAVSHQAAMVGLGVDLGDIVDYVTANDLGTAALVRALAGARFDGPFVVAGSMVVYGEGRYRCAEHGVVRPLARRVAQLKAGEFEPPCPVCAEPLEPEAVPEDAPVDPRNVYAATKLQQEHLCAAFGRETGVPVAALRYHNVYGDRMPRDTPYAGVASILRSALERGEAPRVFEDGGQIRNFVHVRDVARANVLALDARADGAFNVATDTPHTVGELGAALAAAFPGARLPEVTGEYRLGDVRHVFAATERAAAELGFRSAVSFEQGTKEFAVAPLRAPTRR